MTASNLAVCFLPSLFRVTDYQQKTPPANSTRAGKTPGVHTPRGSTSGGTNPGGSATVADGYPLRYKSALTCLATLIANADYLLRLDDDIRHLVDDLCQSDTVPLCHPQLGDTNAIWRTGSELDASSDLLQRLFDEVLFYVNDQGKTCNWVSESSESNELSISRFVDVEHDSRLPVWRVSVELDSPPLDVLNRLRSPWTLSSMFTRWKTVAQPSDDVDIVQYAINLPALDRTRCFRIIRSWRYQSKSERYLFVSTSVHHPQSSTSLPPPAAAASLTAVADDNEVEARLIAGHYVIEPRGVGKSMLIHFSSIDFRGHSEDWYQAVFGGLCASHVLEIRESLRLFADSADQT